MKNKFLLLIIVILAFSTNRECDHFWINDPFWVTSSGSAQEPKYYAPSGLVKVQHCKKCGVVRLKEEFWDQDGSFLVEKGKGGLSDTLKRK